MSVLWTSPDGLWGVVKAKDVPPGVARSKTRDTLQEAENASWDPGFIAPVGPGSLQKYVKVRLSDLPNAGPQPTVTLRPGDYAEGNRKGRKFIPDYPHRCAVCGGKMLVLFSSQEHEGGVCPGPAPKPSVFKKRK